MISKQLNWQNKVLKQGRCRVCAKKRCKRSAYFCEEHRIVHNERNKEYRKIKKQMEC